MASAFSHAVIAVVVGKAWARCTLPMRFWGLSILCALLPDLDVIGFAIGIEYGHLLGHRGLTHSLPFALGLSLVVVWVGFPAIEQWSRSWWGLIAHFFLVTASHGFLDAITDGGLGVAFFAPFDNARYFLPWRPVKVSPIGVSPFFTQYGLEVLISELIWIWIPAGLMLVAAMALRKRSVNGS
ncbi:MAG: metal-dependent hydrolase [Nitrospiraceae bacterium]